MKMKRLSARGRPLAVFLVSLCALALPLVAAESPYLEVRQSVEPQTVYVAGMGGDPTDATVTLVVEGTGSGGRLPIDCVLVIDTSASAAIADAKRFAFDLLGLFSAQDRVGLVTFSTSAKLVVPLTGERSAVGPAIADLAAAGKSALGDGLKAARDQLVKNGRERAVLAVILFTDGQSDSGRGPEMQAEAAKEAGILVVSVGIGNLVNRSLLQELASETGGAFVERPSDAAWERIRGVLTADLAARDVRVEKVLPRELRYVGATPAPDRVKENPDGTTTLSWAVASIGLGGQWSTQIGLQVKVKGSWSTDKGSSVSFGDFRGRQQKVAVPAATIAALEPNLIPHASFSYVPAEPTTADSVEFAEASSDRDGRVVAWAWDFGDGETSVAQDPEHRFARSGMYAVRLTVVDDEGASSVPFEATVAVASGPSMTASRDIEMCLPDHQTIPGGIVTVTVTIRANTTIDGLTLHEAMPAGWTLAPASHERATFRADTVDWLFLEPLRDGDVRVVRYTLTAPAALKPGQERESVSISGLAGSSSPRISLMVLGDDKVTCAAVLPIPVVISRWDTDQNRIDPCLPSEISFAQIQYAVSLWLSGAAVPQTGNQRIDLKMMQDLIAYWLTNRSVFEPLP